MELGFEPISLIPKSVFLTVKNCNSKLHFYSQFTQFTVEQIIPGTAVGKKFFFALLSGLHCPAVCPFLVFESI